MRRTSEMHSPTVTYAVLRADLMEVPVNLTSAGAEQQKQFTGVVCASDVQLQCLRLIILCALQSKQLIVLYIFSI